MAIAYVSSAAANSTTVSMPSHQAGDLIIVFAGRSNNSSAPSLASGYTGLDTLSASTFQGDSSLRVGWKVAASGSEATGTWSNANRITVMVYRGASIGSYSKASNSSNINLSWPALSGFDSGTDWCVRGGVSSSGTPSLPSGFTNRQNSTGRRGCDTNGTSGNVSSTGSGVGGFEGVCLFTIRLTVSSNNYDVDSSTQVTFAPTATAVRVHNAVANAATTASRTASTAQGFTGVASSSWVANRSAAIAYVAGAAASLGITGVTSAAVEANLAAAASLSIAVDRSGDVRLTTPTGSTVVVASALPVGITVGRYTSGSLQVSMSSSAEAVLAQLGDVSRAINVTLSATAATGIIGRQVDIVALLIAACEVQGVTAANMWVSSLLLAVAKVYANIAADETAAVVDIPAVATSVAPGASESDPTLTTFTAVVTAIRGVWCERVIGADFAVAVLRTAGGDALAVVLSELVATVEGDMVLAGPIPVGVDLFASIHVEWRPVVSGERVMRVEAEDRSEVVDPDMRLVRIGIDGREYVSRLE